MAGLVWRANQTAAPDVVSPVSSTLVVISPTKQILLDGSIVELKDGAQISDRLQRTGARRFLRGTAYFRDQGSAAPVCGAGGRVGGAGRRNRLTTELADRGNN